MGSEPLRLLAPWRNPVNHVHDDLLEHEDGEEKCAYVLEGFVDEGCPTHAKVAVEETEGVTLIDQRLFVLLLVLPVLQDDNRARMLFELEIEFNDCVRVNDDIYPKTRQVVLGTFNCFNHLKPFTKLFHAQEPDTPSDRHRQKNETNGDEEVFGRSLFKHCHRLLSGNLLDEVGCSPLGLRLRLRDFLFSLIDRPHVLQYVLFALPALDVNGGPAGEHEEVRVVPLGIEDTEVVGDEAGGLAFLGLVL